MKTLTTAVQAHPPLIAVDGMELSVIIPTYNTGHLIGDQLEALANQELTGAWEVIVSDNGSTDNTSEVVARYGERLPLLRIVDASARPGSAYARNLGAREARGEMLVFIDADDIIAPGFLKAVKTALTRHEFVAPRIEAVTLNRTWASQLGEHPQYHGLMRYYNEPYLYHASGCGLGIKRDTFLRLGGFDESLLRLQDSEFCFRAQLAGVPMHFVQEALVHMRNRASVCGVIQQSRGWGRAEVQLAGRYRGTLSLPAAAYRWLRYFARWLKLVVVLLRCRSNIDLLRWTQECARQVGIFEEALRSRSAPV